MKKTKLPKIIKGTPKPLDEFPLKYYSYSSFVKFSTNPIMFKINYINGDKIENTNNISAVIGQAFHLSMENYYSNIVSEESDAIKTGLEHGMSFLEEYNDGWIEYSKTVQNKQKAQEIFAFAFNSYVTEKKQSKNTEIVDCEVKIHKPVNVEWNGKKLSLPVPLMGYIDKVIRVDGKLKIVDYKTTRAFSNPDKIDGSKIIQAIQYFLLVYAEYGEEPYSMVYEEVKTTKNRDGSEQVRIYEIIYKDYEQFFDFYFRFYDDMTRAINGEAVFVPNILTFFDNEVSIISYIHRLDETEEQARLMEKFKVDNLTNLLKKKMESSGNIRKLMKNAEKKFSECKNINYKDMEKQDQIKTKLLEHGMMINFDSKVEGYSVDLYKFSPSIGLKMSKLKSYVADIEQVIGVSGVRVLAPIPNTSLIGFEVPRVDRRFPEVMPEAKDFDFSMGVTITGDNYVFDLRKAPHVLISGATGSGKSVFLNCLISQLSKMSNVDLHLFDPKMVELAQFRDEAVEYYDDSESIALALSELVKEMNIRYKTFSENKVRNIEEYSGSMNYKFIVIDEFGDLTIGNKETAKYIKESMLILAQKARACGIHLIIATQRPSTKIITGDIKANFPTKVAFRASKAIDSQVLLGESGAEKLLGKGDMIFSSDEGDHRLQGYNI